MNTYIVIATKDELALVERHPEFGTAPVIITGVGAANVITALRDLPRDSHIINLGYAGSPDLEIGKEYKVGMSRLLHEVEYEDTFFSLDYGPTCYTGTDFVQAAHQKGLYDMELAFICALGFHVTSLKTVSDHCNYEEYERNIK